MSRIVAFLLLIIIILIIFGAIILVVFLGSEGFEGTIFAFHIAKLKHKIKKKYKKKLENEGYKLKISDNRIKLYVYLSKESGQPYFTTIDLQETLEEIMMSVDKALQNKTQWEISKNCDDSAPFSKEIIEFMKVVGLIHIVYIALFIVDGVLFGSDLSFGRFCREYLPCCPFCIMCVICSLMRYLY